MTAAVIAASTAADSARPAGSERADSDVDGIATVPLPVLTGILPAWRRDPIPAAPDAAAAGHGRPGRARGRRPQGRRPAGHSGRLRGSLARGAPTRTPPPAELAAQQRGVGRALVTPWFAAATGFVIAASLWIYSPHPRLTFPVTIGSMPRCAPGACRPEVGGNGSGKLAIASGQPIQPTQRPLSPTAGAGARRPTRTAATGLSFGYLVQQTWNGRFDVIITVTGKSDVSFKHWTLAFTLPGARIRFVYGAHWLSVTGDSGIASALSGDPIQWRGGPGGSRGGHAGAGYRSGGQGASHADGRWGWPGQPGVSFMVIASGKPTGPVHCAFDGAACKFQRRTGG
jgi:hypothetical protein